MYEILKTRIHTGGFKLADIQARAKKLYAMGDLSDEQLDELMQLSQKNASPEAERPETLKILQSLSERVGALEKKLAQQNDPETETESSEYKEWVQPIAGLTDDYQYGAITAHSGKLWMSTFKGQNVWEPGTPGTENLWVEYIEEVTENA